MEIITLDHQAFKKYMTNAPVTHSYYQTPAGLLQIATTPLGIFQAHFVTTQKNRETAQLIDVKKMILAGTEFQIRVWQELLTLPTDTTITYQELALRIGHPNSWRAVANAIGSNNIAYFIPCHLVVRKNGELGGYRWGVERKKLLLGKPQ